MRQELTTVTRIRWTSFEQLRAVAQAERRTVPEQLSIIIEDWLRAKNEPGDTQEEPQGTPTRQGVTPPVPPPVEEEKP